MLLFEPRWSPRQRPSQAPLTTLDVAHVSCPNWREFRLLVHIYRERLFAPAGKTGLLSRKFELKSRVTPEAFAAFAEAQEDADVCMVNAFPMVPYLAHDVWMHAEGYHPGIVERAQDLLDAAELDFQLAHSPRHTPALTCMCNFWVGTPEVWEAFVGGVLDPMARYLEAHPNSTVSQRVLETADYLNPVPYLPFIAERMFTTFLATTPGLKLATYPLAPLAAEDYCMTDFTRTAVRGLRPAVDAADNEGHYPASLKDQQRLVCQLAGIFHQTYYATHPHPFMDASANA
ncbi:hypothetical protein [Hydrogenophaga sp. 5NK40-0174]|uniref:hypothetical protein n=1 Tax=Hydrogenophaga sp. 5NK40-0174 TaxID=3127649 RepID=UPI00310A0083